MITTPSGHFLYCASGNGAGTKCSIWEFRVLKSGRLKPLIPNAIKVKSLFSSYPTLVINPSGTYLYVLTDNGVIVFTIKRDGVLSSSRIVLRSREPIEGFSISANRKYAYVADYNANTVLMYRVMPSGMLQPLKSGTLSVTRPGPLLASPTRPFLYVLSDMNGLNPITVYHIEKNGSLMKVASPVGYGVGELDIDPTGEYLYAPRFGGGGGTPGDIEQYRIKPNGALVPLKPPYLNVGANPKSLTIIQH